MLFVNFRSSGSCEEKKSITLRSLSEKNANCSLKKIWIYQGCQKYSVKLIFAETLHQIKALWCKKSIRVGSKTKIPANQKRWNKTTVNQKLGIQQNWKYSENLAVTVSKVWTARRKETWNQSFRLKPNQKSGLQASGVPNEFEWNASGHQPQLTASTKVDNQKCQGSNFKCCTWIAGNSGFRLWLTLLFNKQLFERSFKKFQIQCRWNNLVRQKIRFVANCRPKSTGRSPCLSLVFLRS